MISILKLIKNLYREIRISILRTLVMIYGTDLPVYNKILIIAPHPDDEILGCGGLIIRQMQNNKKVSVIILSGGEASHAGCCNIDADKLKKERRTLSLKAAEITKLPHENIHFLNFVDGNINKTDREVENLQKTISQINPDAVFVTNPYEKWSDHILSGEFIKELLFDKNIALFEYCVWFWFYMPLRKIFNINWKKAQAIKLSDQEMKLKNLGIDCYINPKAECSKPYSGVLPKTFIQSNRWNKELYFKIK